MASVLLTGPSASGKNAVAASYARLHERCALVDVDVVRYMVAQPRRLAAAVVADLYPNEAGDWQAGVDAACALANAFTGAGYEVVVIDVLNASGLERYRSRLGGGLFVAQLLPSLDVVLDRHRARSPEPDGSFMRAGPLVEGNWRMSESDVLMLYRQQEAFDSGDLRIDNSAMDADNAAKAVLQALRRRSA